MNLKVSEANTTNGAADLNAINWFRYYNFKSGPVTTRIDAIEIIDPDGGEKYILIVNDGQGTGAFYAGSEIPISAEPAPEGQQFDTWVINEGTPSIADLNAASTTLTMTAQDADITATYKEAEVSVPQSVANEQYITIYPNPLEGGELYIKLVGIENAAKVNVLVTNLLGQTVYQSSIEYSDHIMIDVSALQKSSIYVLTVETGQSLFTKKLIVE